MDLFTIHSTSTQKKGWYVQVANNNKPCMITQDFVRQLAEIVDKADNTKDLSHLTLWLPTYFAKRGKISLSGGNLDEMKELRKNPDEQLAFFQEAKKCFMRLQQLGCLTSICFEGSVIGGGVEFAAAFDLRWTTVDGVIWCPQLFNGLSSGFGGETWLAQKFGRGFAEFLLYAGKQCLPHDLPPHFYADATAQSHGELENLVAKHLKKFDSSSAKGFQWQKQSLSKPMDVPSEVLQNQAYAAFLEKWAQR